MHPTNICFRAAKLPTCDLVDLCTCKASREGDSGQGRRPHSRGSPLSQFPVTFNRAEYRWRIPSARAKCECTARFPSFVRRAGYRWRGRKSSSNLRMEHSLEPSLFGAERLHRIDPSRASSRQICRCQAASCEKQRDDSHRPRVIWLDSIKECSQ